MSKPTIRFSNRFQYTEYEKVVIEDHFEKDKDRRKAEQEKFELESSIKVTFNLQAL